jgi:hypothetical protein
MSIHQLFSEYMNDMQEWPTPSVGKGWEVNVERQWEGMQSLPYSSPCRKVCREWWVTELWTQHKNKVFLVIFLLTPCLFSCLGFQKFPPFPLLLHLLLLLLLRLRTLCRSSEQRALLSTSCSPVTCLLSCNKLEWDMTDWFILWKA